MVVFLTLVFIIAIWLLCSNDNSNDNDDNDDNDFDEVDDDVIAYAIVNDTFNSSDDGVFESD